MKIEYKTTDDEFEIALDKQSTKLIRIYIYQGLSDHEGAINSKNGTFVLPYEMINPIIARLKDLRDEF